MSTIVGSYKIYGYGAHSVDRNIYNFLQVLQIYNNKIKLSPTAEHAKFEIIWPRGIKWSGVELDLSSIEYSLKLETMLHQYMKKYFKHKMRSTLIV